MLTQHVLDASQPVGDASYCHVSCAKIATPGRGGLKIPYEKQLEGDYHVAVVAG